MKTQVHRVFARFGSGPRAVTLRGQASTEYLIALLFFGVVLLVATTDYPTVAWRELIDAFLLAYKRISFALSLPT